MILPFQVAPGTVNKDIPVVVKFPEKSGNSLNAGIDFYVPTGNASIEFNPGLGPNKSRVMSIPEHIFMPEYLASDEHVNTIIKGYLPTLVWKFKETFDDIGNTDNVRSWYKKYEDMKLTDFPIRKRFLQSKDNNLVDGELPIYWLYPGENAKIDSGIIVEIDIGQFGLVCNRSGVASKENCIVGAEIIDCGYANRLFFDIHNIGDTAIPITPGMKITQMIIMQYISCTPKRVDNLYGFFDDIKFRGSAGFGSTDKK